MSPAPILAQKAILGLVMIGDEDIIRLYGTPIAGGNATALVDADVTGTFTMMGQLSFLAAP
jgi:hypothetical protein